MVGPARVLGEEAGDMFSNSGGSSGGGGGGGGTQLAAGCWLLCCWLIAKPTISLILLVL